jgi:hypothetical protein
VTDLASKKDVEALIGRDLTAGEVQRLPEILAKLSELFRAESGQAFTPGESSQLVKVNRGKAYLRQRPVVEVSAVELESGTEITGFRCRGQWLYVPGVANGMVWVTYSHGADDVPDLVRTTIADAARQVLQIDPAAVSGRSQESEGTGPFVGSTSYATWAQGGSTRLSPEDRAIARGFRVRTGNVWVT